jgi:HSP20 family molecular chaperone IbpA
MWAEACELVERADRLHRQFFQLGQTRACRPVWEPPADVVETPQGVRIVVALPGVPADQVEVHFDGQCVTVAGERPAPFSVAGSRVHRAEIPYGRFERRIEISGTALVPESSRIEHGCLVLDLAKRD